MAEKVHRYENRILDRSITSSLHWLHQMKSRKGVAAQSEIGNLAGLQLKLQFVSDKGDELTIRGFSLGIGNCVPEEPLQGVQIPSVPGHFDGVADGALYAGRGGLECFCHLGIQYLGDGIGVLAARLGAF